MSFMAAAEPTAQAPLRHRCIIWHSSSTEPDPDLIAALVSRRMHVVACSNAFDALAHVCAAARHSGSHGARAATPATILVLSDPGELPGVVNVVTLTGRYAARAACWTFEASGSRRLRPIEREDVEQWQRGERAASGSNGLSLDRPLDGSIGFEREPAARQSGRGESVASAESSGDSSSTSQSPRLRLAGEGPISLSEKDLEPVAKDNFHHTGKVGGIRQHLSDEELKMLLAIDPERGQN